MIHINLLPWREQQREIIRKRYLQLFIITLLGSIITIVVLHFFFNNKLQAQQTRVNFLQQQSNAYQSKIVQVGKQQRLKTDIHERLKIIKTLQHNRAMVAHLFKSFASIAPDGVYFTAINRNAGQLEFFGKADSNAQVSQLMRNVKASPWLNDAKLRVIKVDEQNQYKRLFELQVIDKALSVKTQTTDKK